MECCLPKHILKPLESEYKVKMITQMEKKINTCKKKNVLTLHLIAQQNNQQGKDKGTTPSKF